MAETQGDIGLGSTIAMGDGGSPETFSTITEAKDIDGPEITQEYTDFTHMQSPGGYRERKPTVKSNGNVTFRCNKLAGDTVQDALVTAANANPATESNYKLTFPDGDYFIFPATPSIKWSDPMLSAMEIQVTLAISGDIIIG